MKKYKSAILFIIACAIIAGMILLVNNSLSKILPDYENEPRQYDHTIMAEESTASSSFDNEIDFSKPYTVSQACSFYYDNEILDKVYEAAEDTMRRSEERVPTETVKIMDANKFTSTVFSSKRKKINGRRYFDITYDVRKKNYRFNSFLIYSEDKTEIYFLNAIKTHIEYSNEVTDAVKKDSIIYSCKSLIAAGGSELLSAFDPDLVWESPASPNIYSESFNPDYTNYYLLRDNTNKIIIEYNPGENEILSFSIGK